MEELFELYPEIAKAFGEVQPINHDPTYVYVPAVEFRRISDIAVTHAAGHLRGGGGGNMAARRSMFDAIGMLGRADGLGTRFRTCEEYDVLTTGLRERASRGLRSSDHRDSLGRRSYADGSGGVLKRTDAYGEGAVIGKHLGSATANGDRGGPDLPQRTSVSSASCVAPAGNGSVSSGGLQVGRITKGVIAPRFEPPRRGLREFGDSPSLMRGWTANRNVFASTGRRRPPANPSMNPVIRARPRGRLRCEHVGDRRPQRMRELPDGKRTARISPARIGLAHAAPMPT